MVLAALFAAAGCVPQQLTPDAGFIYPPGYDSGAAPDDDAGTSTDTGVTPTDTGVPPADSGVEGTDAGQPADTGVPADAGLVDAGPRPDAGTVPPTGARYQTPNGTRHIYSQLQAWTVDGVYYLTVDINSGEGVVYHAGTWEERARLGHIGHRWITGTHQVLMFEDIGRRAVLIAYD